MDFASVPEAFRAQRGALFALLGFSFALNLLLLVSPLYMMLVFDHVLTSRSEATLAVLTGIAAFALLFFGIFDALRAQIQARIALRINAGLAPTMLARSIAVGRRTPPGTTGHAMHDLATLRTAITGGAATALMDAPWAVLFALALFILHPLLGFAGVIGGLLLLAIAAAGDWSARSRAQSAQRLGASLAEWLDALTRNMGAVAGMGIARGAEREWRARNAALADAQIAAADRSAVTASLSRCARLLMQIAILALGAHLVLQRQIGAGSMVAASLLLARMLAPIEGSIAAWRLIGQARLALRRLQHLLSLDGDPRPALAPAGALTLEEVAYVPPGAEAPVLRHVSLRLEPGEALGILGPSGAGKSSLAQLLVGAAIPASGHLRLGGVELERCRWETAASRGIGYLPQGGLLLPGSIAQNIAGFAETTPEAAAEAATLAGLHEAILHLPLGYDTPVDDTLPAGLRQGIAVARACFGAPALVVLDEPTAHLDGAGKDALLRAIARLRQAGTMLVVVSREPALVEGMDKLALLNRGRLVSFGPRAEVLSGLGLAPPMRAPANLGARRLA